MTLSHVLFLYRSIINEFQELSMSYQYGPSIQSRLTRQYNIYPNSGIMFFVNRAKH